MPRRGIVEGVERLHASADLDQLAALTGFVRRIESDRHAAGSAVVDSEGAELAFVLLIALFLQERSGALEEHDRSGADDCQKELSPERLTVVGIGAQGDSGAEGEAP